MSQSQSDVIIVKNDRFKQALPSGGPALILLHDSKLAAPLRDAAEKVARQYGDELAVLLLDASTNPDSYIKLGEPELPAVVTMIKRFFGRKVHSEQAGVRPADIRAHAAAVISGDDVKSADKKQDQTAAKGGGEPVVVTDKTWRREVLRSKTPVLVDFWATWCAPCRTIAPTVAQLADEYNGTLKVVKLDTDANPVISRRYGIRSIPTLAIIENGQVVDQMSGADPGGLRRMVRRTLGE